MDDSESERAAEDVSGKAGSPEATLNLEAVPRAIPVTEPEIITVTEPEPVPVTAPGAVLAAVPAAAPRPRAPWYVEANALGEFEVSGLALWRPGMARGEADAFAAAFGPAPDGVASAESVREDVVRRVHEILRVGEDGRGTEADLDAWKAAWTSLLRHGAYLVSGGHVVWIRPVVRRPVHAPPSAEVPGAQQPREYEVHFAGVGTGHRTTRAVTKAWEAAVQDTLYLANSALAGITPGMPTLTLGVDRSTDEKTSTEVVSGRKVLAAGHERFRAGLAFQVYVDGRPWANRHVTAPRISVRLPEKFTAADAPAVDRASAPAHRARPGHRIAGTHLVVHAIDTGPVIAAVTARLRDAGLPAKAVVDIAGQLSEELVSETSFRNRGRWALTSGDLSNPIVKKVSGLSSFSGIFTFRAWIDRLEPIGRLPSLTVRDDMGLSRTFGNGRRDMSRGELGVGVDLVGIEAPHAAHGSHGYALARYAVSWERGYSTESAVMSMNKTTLTREETLQRYRSTLAVEVTVDSHTHTVEPAGTLTAAELTVPVPEADEFEHRTVGAMVSNPRSLALVRRQPHVQQVMRAAADLGVLPVRDVRRPAWLDRARPPAHPREPMPLASGRGQGFGMLLNLPGSEAVYTDVLDVLRAKVALRRAAAFPAGLKVLRRMSPAVRWARTQRTLSATFGTPALEADLPTTLSGLDYTVAIGGVRYDVSVDTYLGRRDESASRTVDMTVNARSTFGSTVDAMRHSALANALTFSGSARVKLLERLKLEFGNVDVVGRHDRSKGDGTSDVTKGYRRTETSGEVDVGVYEAVYEVSVREGGPGGSTDTWYLHGPGFTATFLTPLQHQPRPAHESAPTPDPLERVDELPRTGLVRFSAGTDGVYPAFLTMPQLVRWTAEAHARLGGTAFSPRRGDWPQIIKAMLTPTGLQAHFEQITSPRGWTERLPPVGGWKQSITVRARAYDAAYQHSHTKDDNWGGEVEIEQYAQAAHQLGREKGHSTAVKAEGGGGLLFQLSKGAEHAHDTNADTNTDAPATSTRRTPANQISLTAAASGSFEQGSRTSSAQGYIDITRATYAGTMHTFRSDAGFEITLRRWKGRKEQSADLLVHAPQVLDFVTPQRRVEDLGLTLPPHAQETPPSVSEGRATRPIDLALALGSSHAEAIDADAVQYAITDTLRRRGLLPRPTAALPDGRTTLLSLWVDKEFSRTAMKNDWMNLHRTGMTRWVPVHTALGTRLLWVRVTAAVGDVTGHRPRPETKLTLRSEGLRTDVPREVSQKKGLRVAGRAQGHGTIDGEVVVGLSAEGGYTAERSKTRGEEITKKDIFRVSARGGSEEYDHPLTYKVEMGVSFDPPAVVQPLVRGARAAAFAAGDAAAKLLDHPSGIDRLWYDRQPGWFETVDSRPDPLDGGRPAPLAGSVRLVTPSHLTVTAAPEELPPQVPATGFGENVRWADASRPPRMPSTMKVLSEFIHPVTAPVSHALARWAGLTTVPRARRPRTLDGDAWQVPGLGLRTFRGLRLAHFTSESMVRANVASLLTHTYEIPGTGIRIGLDITHAERLPVPASFKARRYAQNHTEAKSAAERQSGWEANVNAILGGYTGDGSGLAEAMPRFVYGRRTGEEDTVEPGEVHERDKEEVIAYRYYRLDVTAVIRGPAGTLAVDMPAGFYSMLREPVADAFEAAAPHLFRTPPRDVPPVPVPVPVPAPVPTPTPTPNLDADPRGRPAFDSASEPRDDLTAPTGLGAVHSRWSLPIDPLLSDREYDVTGIGAVSRQEVERLGAAIAAEDALPAPRRQEVSLLAERLGAKVAAHVRQDLAADPPRRTTRLLLTVPHDEWITAVVKIAEVVAAELNHRVFVRGSGAAEFKLCPPGEESLMRAAG